MGVEQRLGEVKEVLAGVPRHGIGYGLLRYGERGGEWRERLRQERGAEIIFNYLGQLDEVLPPESIFMGVEESSGQAQDGRQRRSHVFQVVAHISGGKLKVGWSYSRQLHRRETVERLADRFLKTLQALVACCRTGAIKPGKTFSRKELDLSAEARRKLLSKVSVYGTAGGNQ